MPIQFGSIPASTLQARKQALATKVCPPKLALTPEERFDKIIKFDSKSKAIPRKYHFKLITIGDTTYLFNGLRVRLFEVTNPDYVARIREVRCFAVELFCKANKKDINGGYLIDEY